MRNSRKIKKLRNKAAQGQKWRCYYAENPCGAETERLLVSASRCH